MKSIPRCSGWILLLFFALSSRLSAAPANDARLAGTPISGTIVSTTGSNVGATREPGEQFHAGNPGGASVWWRWTAPANMQVTINTVGSSFDTLLAVYAQFEQQLFQLTSNDDTGTNLQSGVNFTTFQGNPTYYIAVDGFNPGINPATAAQGSIRLNISTLPTVLITSPPNGAVFTGPTNITNSVTVTPAGTNTITRVDFYAGNNTVGFQVIGSDTTPPFSIVWSNATPDAYDIYARAFDSAGLNNFGGPSSITINAVDFFPVTLLPARSDWRFLDTGTNLGATWVGANFDDSRWRGPSPGPLGFGDPHIATTVNSGPAGNFFITTYFRRQLVVTNAERLSSVTLRLLRDDGAVIYANSNAVLFSNMPFGVPVDYLARAFNSIGGAAESAYTATRLGPEILIPGTNTLAVEVHQQAPSSTDLGFDLEIIGGVSSSVRLTSPFNGTLYNGPGTIFLGAVASAASGSITQVNFYASAGLAGTVLVGAATNAPYNAVWTPAPLGDYGLYAVSFADTGRAATSSVANVSVIVSEPPVIVAVDPPAGEIAALTSLRVTFSRGVWPVDPEDLLVNGVPASKAFTYDYTNYFFSFSPPSGNTVTISWAANADIFDIASPPLPFDPMGANATWSYTIFDLAAPLVIAQAPPAGASLSELTNITVTFNEPVSGVDAADLLVNGVPATSVAGSQATYTFGFAQPPPGTAAISWASGHDIRDIAPAMNPFDRTSPGATWSYDITLPQAQLVSTNAIWRFLSGTSEASVPADAWRTNDYAGEASWQLLPAVFYYGENWPVGSLITGMQDNYSSIFLRHTFLVTNAARLTDLRLRAQCDDGYIAWLNGVEIFRYNMPPGDVPFNGFAANTVAEQGVPSVPFIVNSLPGAEAALRTGTNVLAVQVFNATLNSTDLVFDGELLASVTDPRAVPPGLVSVNPPPGNTTSLTNITVTFSEPVTGVNASDLIIAGVPAIEVSGSDDVYTFRFPQPAFGTVLVTWDPQHGIQDQDNPPKSFNGAAASFSYTFINANAPVLALRNPTAGATVSNLAQITLTWNEPVTGVEASDLLVNGSPASGISGGGATRTFTFPQPPFGTVNVAFALNPGITDFDQPANAFDSTAPGTSWQYTLRDLVPPVIVSRTPPAGASISNLTEIAVVFSEPVTNVNASDLLINGVAATNVVAVAGTNYTFRFPQPNAKVVRVTWAANHGITDRAAIPNPFNGSAPSASWQYNLIDRVAPTLASTSPAPGGVLKSLTQITLAFSEDVGGVDASDLRVNGAAAASVVGSLRGPYTFNFAQTASSNITVSWIATHGIHDFASPSNLFVTNVWTYKVVTNLNPPAVVLNEIMYNAPGANTNDEWIELLNTGTSPLNLTGWRFSDGVQFTFPNVTLGAGAYLIVAANPARFGSTHPGMTNIFGPWTGFLNNSGEEIELRDASGALVDSVRYSDEGEWGVRQRGPNDRNAYGWEWFAEHDGLGKSLELANPALPGDSGQNWKASLTPNGTPGGANSVFTTNLPPLILNARHSPAIPRSTNNITIAARLVDEQTNGLTATLFYRNHSSLPPPAFSSTNLFDDGLHGDGGANDGFFAVVLPPQTNRTVIEFFIRAVDAGNHTNFWPAPAGQTNLTTSQAGQIFAQTANALFQVDDFVYSGANPVHRLIMTESERVEFQTINRQSDAEMNCTLIISDGANTDLRYLCGMRIRGAGSRNAAVPNYRVNLRHDTPWNGATELNHNAQYGFNQVLGAALAQKSGLVAANARTIQVRVNGQNLANGGLPQYGNYALYEVFNGDWAEIHLPADADGNVYRASTGNHSASFDDRGVNPASYIAAGFAKVSNASENDWSDLILLCQTLNNTPDASYAPAVRAAVDVEQWMRYFAFFSLTVSRETSLGNGRGDDYALYRGVQDTRFQLLVHDLDTILGQGDTASVTNTPLFRMIFQAPGHNPPNVPQLFRFMRQPEFVPGYFRELKRLAETVFSPAEFNPLIDQTLGSDVPTLTLNNMKTYARDRASWVLSQIPLRLVINGAPAPGGFLTSTNGVISLAGTANVIDTRSVLVNGEPAAWSAADMNWSFANVPLAPGINRVLVQALDVSGAEIDRATVDVRYDDGSLDILAGTLGTNTILSAGAGPYLVNSTIVVPSGGTLTIQPGTTLYFAPGAALTVQGQLLAEGNDAQRIRFAAQPGTAGGWGGVTITGGASSPETRITFAHFEGNNATAIHSVGGTVFLDHLTFGATDRQYVSLDASSFVVSECVFPRATAAFEMVHGNGGIKSGGRGLFLRNFFGAANGYNDTVDFTGGNRPGPIVQFIDNVFTGSDDDILDLDGTDAWIEGNIFLHVHRNGSPDSASAVSGGNDGSQTSEVTLVGNLFFDVDQAANAKQGNFYTMVNNTIVRQTKTGSQDTNTAVVILADDSTTQGAGIYLEGNIILDAENLTRNVTTALVTFTNNIIRQLTGAPWAGPGGGNSSDDPLLVHVPQLAETAFTSWAQAQVMRQWLSLAPGSPARGTGPNGRDKGGVIPLGVSLSGEPEDVTLRTTATLRVGTVRSGSGIPVAGFANGSGYTHYRWRLDGGAWSAELPMAAPITLSALANGPHSVDVVGRRDSGLYQDDPVLGVDAFITSSRRWTVDTTAPPLRLSEVLARNVSAVNHSGTFPDIVELHNRGASSISLTAMRLTDDPANPNKFVFPNVSIAAGQFLLLYADSAQTPGIHLGFGLDADGDQLLLFDRNARGGALLDAVSWGPQLADLSIGRLPEGGWSLTQPTFGTTNRAARMSDPRRLHINEWLASPRPPFIADFVELYNPAPLPVPLGGLFFSDQPSGLLGMHEIAPLSFTAAGGFTVFTADGEPSLGPLHLNFQLASEQGAIALSDQQLNLIDCVIYGPQTTGVSQGRVPSGSATVGSFTTPTPGSANPPPTGTNLNIVLNEILANNVGFREPDGSTPDWVELYNPSTNAVDLGDMSLTDDTFDHRRYVFPAGTMIPPLGYRTIRLDGDIPAGTNNTGFGLKATGSGLFLYDKPANGGAPLSSIEFGVQAPDFSIGHVPDATGPWVLNIPTLAGANIAATLGNPASLKVNEWLANPDGDDDWFEIYNPEPQPVALGGLHLTDKLDNRTKHEIAALSFIAAGLRGFQRFVADENTDAGADHVNFRLNGTLGEAIGIADAGGARIDDVTFSPQPETVSQGRLPDGAPTIVSFPLTATPGEANFLPLANVVINEVLTHTDLPFEDAIELRNLTHEDVDLSGWFLSDTENNLRKFRIPDGTMLPGDGFVMLYEYQFNPVVGDPLSFSLNSARGDEVWLSATDTSGALTGFRATVRFGAAEDRVSFGRFVTTVGVDFVAMNQRTLGVDEPANILDFRTGMGAPNSAPKIGPVIISEIHYHPPDVGGQDNSADEYIELQNITAVPVALFHPLFTSNTWRLRDAVDFDFPPAFTLPANGLLLVLNFDPNTNASRAASFRSRFDVPDGTPLFGPFLGKLANDRDNVELYKPDAPQVPPDPDAGLVPYILVERVRYTDEAPWPTNADGGGTTLQRIVPTAYGNEPVNWVAAQPSPGVPTQDFDGDGIPNSWELAFGFNPNDASDAALDSDGDGVSNRQEFIAGTDPTSGLSFLHLRPIEMLGGANPASSIQFSAASNRSYTVLYRDDPMSEVWTKLADVLGPHPVLEVELIDPLPAGGAPRTYGIIVPPLADGSTYVQSTNFAGASFAVESVNLVPQNQFVLGWTLNAGVGTVLESNSTVAGGSWTEVRPIPVRTQARRIFVIERIAPGTTQRFYRFRQSAP